MWFNSAFKGLKNVYVEVMLRHMCKWRTCASGGHDIQTPVLDGKWRSRERSFVHYIRKNIAHNSHSNGKNTTQIISKYLSSLEPGYSHVSTIIWEKVQWERKLVVGHFRLSFQLRCGEVIRYSVLYEDLRYSKEFLYASVKVTSWAKNTYYTAKHTVLLTPVSLQWAAH
jgi:hypothetical protein